MYYTRMMRVITVLFVLLCAMVCPLSQGLYAGLVDEDLACCIRKRYSKSEFCLHVLDFLQKIFNGILSCSRGLPGSLFLAAANRYAAFPLTSLSSTILQL
jgi:hypothetical protein